MITAMICGQKSGASAACSTFPRLVDAPGDENGEDQETEQRDPDARQALADHDAMPLAAAGGEDTSSSTRARKIASEHAASWLDR